jgi:hypothetical protein
VSEHDELNESVEESPELEPADEAKEAMREAVEHFQETIATPRPPERVDVVVDPVEEALESPDLDVAGAVEELGDLLAAEDVELEEPEGGPVEVDLDVAGLAEVDAPELEVSLEEADLDAEPGVDLELEAPEVKVSMAEPDLDVAGFVEEPGVDLEPDEVEIEDVEALEPEVDLAEPDLDVAWFEEASGVELEPEAVPDVTRLEELPADVPEEEQPEEEEEKRWLAGGPPLQVVPASRGAGWGRLLLIGLLSALLGAVLALAALWIVNRTLDFRTATNRAVRAEAFRVDGEFGAVRADLEGVNARVDDLQAMVPLVEQARSDIEGLGDALGAVEIELRRLNQDMTAAQTALATLSSDVGDLGKGLDEVQGQMAAMEERVTTLGEEIEAVRRSAQRFDDFLNGLWELLSAVRPALESPSTEPAAPSGLDTPTPQPMITVIPLASPTPVP